MELYKEILREYLIDDLINIISSYEEKQQNCRYYANLIKETKKCKYGIKLITAKGPSKKKQQRNYTYYARCHSCNTMANAEITKYLNYNKIGISCFYAKCECVIKFKKCNDITEKELIEKYINNHECKVFG